MPFSFRWRHALSLIAVLLAACEPNTETPTTPAQTPPPSVPTYQAVGWSELPQTSEEELLQGFDAWRSACQRLAKDPIWAEPCAAALQVERALQPVQDFLQAYLQPYLLQSPSKGAQGLVTGYYEPVYAGRLVKDAQHSVAVYGIPNDMLVVALEELYPELKGKRLRGRLEGRVLKPYADAASIRRDGVDAPVLAWLSNPMDLQFLQIQGSGRVQLADGTQLRLGYADQNGHPYRPVGRWLIEQGYVAQADMSMARIRQWAEENPQRISELLDSNPSYVFFTRNPDSQEGPRGSLNVPLTAGFSVAIDRRVIPLGSLLWLSTSRPDDQRPLVRPVAAQDTGGAIVGEVRADLFWGTGDAAGELAGHMKQPGQLWLLWPKNADLPSL